MGLKNTWSWLNTKIWTWQWYRDFFAMSYLRYMATWFAIVPVFASIFSSAPDAVSIPTLGAPLILRIALPFNWQLLWIASLLFVAAFLLYLFASPNFVRRYHAFENYKSRAHSPRWIVKESLDFMAFWGADHGKFVQRLIDKNYVRAIADPPARPTRDVGEKTTDLKFGFNGKGYMLSMPRLDGTGGEDAAATEIAVREIFWEVFARYADSRLWARIVVTLLLLSALGCVGWVTLNHIVAGFQYFVR